MIKNWFGMEPHETDYMASWNETKPKEVALSLRHSYDILNTSIENEKLLKFLLGAAYNAAMDYTAENYVGENL